MKKLLIILLVGMIFFAGCEFQMEDSLADIEVGTMDDYYYEDCDNIEINSVEEAMEWCFQNITYIPDNSDYWQLPEETYELKTGDCEDFCIMFMYLLKTKLNIDSELVLVKHPTNGTHVVVWVEEKKIIL